MTRDFPTQSRGRSISFGQPQLPLQSPMVPIPQETQQKSIFEMTPQGSPPFVGNNNSPTCSHPEFYGAEAKDELSLFLKRLDEAHAHELLLQQQQQQNQAQQTVTTTISQGFTRPRSSTGPQPVGQGGETKDGTKDSLQSSQLDEDVLLGSFFLTHLRPICENCGSSETPQWRKGWWSNLLGRSIFLCNACGLRYHKNQFCPYCYFVYSKDEHFDANHEWFTCRVCRRSSHITCETEHRQGRVDEYSYVCPDCIHDLPASF